MMTVPAYLELGSPKGERLILFGPEETTRSDGTGRYVIAQGYALEGGPLRKGRVLRGRVGDAPARFKLTARLDAVVSWEGVVLEWLTN